jgi:hypothetical protein
VAPSATGDMGVWSPPTINLEEQSEVQEADMAKSKECFGFDGGGQGQFGNLLRRKFRWKILRKPLIFLFFTIFIPFYTLTNFVGLIVLNFLDLF